MTYCTQQNLVDRFGDEEILQLTDRDHTGNIDAAVVEQAIADAGAEIDGYVAGAGYNLPLSPVPAILTGYACDIARYRLYDDHAPEQVVKRYDDAIKFLRAIAQGVVSLGIKDPSPSTGSAQMTSGRPSVFKGGGF